MYTICRGKNVNEPSNNCSDSLDKCGSTLEHAHYLFWENFPLEMQVCDILLIHRGIWLEKWWLNKVFITV